MLKVYRRIEPGEHPEIEIGRFLTEHAHVAFAPGLRRRRALGRSRAGDGAGVRARRARAAGTGRSSARWRARRRRSPALGAQTAALHAALREMGTLVADAGRAARAGARPPTGQLDRAAGAGRRRRRRAAAGVGAGRSAPSWPALERPGRAAGARPRARRLPRRPDPASRGGELRVVDFEGEPGRPLAERRPAGHAAARRGGDAAVVRPPRPATSSATSGRARRPTIEDWIVRARAAFLDAYGDHDSGLLRALEFEKETLRVRLRRHLPARVDARRRRRHALAAGARRRERRGVPGRHPGRAGGAGAALARRLRRRGLPAVDGRRVLLLGMGSSRLRLADGGRAAARARASTRTSSWPRPARRSRRPRDTLALVDLGLGRLRGDASRRWPAHTGGSSTVVAVTNRDDSALAARRPTCVLPVLAGPEAGGIACRSYACTLAVLLLACRRDARCRAPRGRVVGGADRAAVGVARRRWPTCSRAARACGLGAGRADRLGRAVAR